MTERTTFALGPLGFAIAGGDWAAWLGAARAGDSLCYAHGLALPAGAPAVIAAREAAAAGLVSLIARRVEINGARATEWLAQKCGEVSSPAARGGISRSQANAAGAGDGSVQDSDDDSIEARLLRVLRRAAAFDQVAPTNAELAAQLGLRDTEAARYVVGKLIKSGAIRVENMGPTLRRIVTITATRKATRAGRL